MEIRLIDQLLFSKYNKMFYILYKKANNVKGSEK